MPQSDQATNQLSWTTNPEEQQTQKNELCHKEIKQQTQVTTSNQTQTQTSSQFSKPRLDTTLYFGFIGC